MTWFAYDIEAYDTDTMHLSVAEDGAYMRLLRHYYRTRVPLPDNDAALAGIARMSLAEWQPMAKTIRAFFRKKAGVLHQKRADFELDGQDKRMRRRSEKAGKAAEKRWSKKNGFDATSMAQASPSINGAAHSDARSMLGDAIKTRQRQDSDKKEESDSESHVLKSTIAHSRKGSARAVALAIDGEFEKVFWPAYPVKDGKQPAKKAFIKARKIATLDAIMHGLTRYCLRLSQPGAPKPKYAQGWLNDARWNDQGGGEKPREGALFG